MNKLVSEITEYIQKPVRLENFVELNRLFTGIERDLALAPSLSAQWENALIRLFQAVPMHDLYFLYLASAMAELFPKAQYVRLLLDGALCSGVLSTQNREFILFQVSSLLFSHPELSSPELERLSAELHGHIVRELKAQLRISPAPKSARRQNRAIVMTANFLSERHAPTHSSLERALLLRQLGETSVTLVSTTEGASSAGRIPFFRAYAANRIDAYDGRTSCEYRGEAFDFRQPAGSVNTAEVLQQLIDYVEELAPYYIVYVGGRSFVADILNDYCPVVTVSTVFSTIPAGNTAFSIVGRRVSEQERAAHASEIIEVPFSFELSEKKRSYSRAELGIPEDAFVMAVVGNRLDSDIRDDFLSCLGRVENGFLLLIGRYDAYPQKLRQFSWLAEHSLSPGYVDDVTGMLECADLYVNPRRLGGGFSVIEAFHAGIPAVSVRYGDVAAAAGEEFCVDDYEEMLPVIRRYQTDDDFRRAQLLLAKDREREATDGSRFYREGIARMLEHPRFY